LLISVLPILAAGCSDNTDTTPTTPSIPQSTTETFSGVLALNGAATYTFPVATPGAISAALTSLTFADGSAGTPLAIGIALGTWNGSICNITLSNDSAVQGSTVPGQVNVLGNFCLRVSDVSGKVVNPEAYTVTVTHPQ
jgi:hypothetical protein